MKQGNKINIHNIFWYIVIYSIIGMLIETIYGYVTMGIIDCRKGLIWGPFSPIYGVGAAVLTIILSRFKDNPVKLFAYGIVIGAFFEYLISYGLESIYSTRFWEYSYLKYNLNGRIAILFSLFWGILSFVVIKISNPLIDKLINKLSEKKLKVVEIMLAIFLCIDIIATIWGIKSFEIRSKNNYYGIEIKQYNNLNIFQKIEYKLERTIFSDNVIIKAFPNLRFIDKKGQEIFYKDIINSI